MIKVFVFDTNVIISAHLLQNSESRKAFNLAQNIGIFAYSRETLHELETVFSVQNSTSMYLSRKGKKQFNFSSRVELSLKQQANLTFVEIKRTICYLT
jgi:predicted nucleic acid-binding protein